MPLLTQYRSFFVSPFGEAAVCDELNAFLKSHRIVNVEKRLIDGERGTGWLFLIEYGSDNKNPSSSASSPRIDYREILNEQEYALFDKLRQLRKELAEKQGIPVYAIFTTVTSAAGVREHISPFCTPSRNVKGRNGFSSWTFANILILSIMMCLKTICAGY